MKRLLAAAAIFLAATTVARAEPMVERIDFEVTRGGDPLGWQRLRIARDGDRAIVEVMIDFELKFGPIALYRYTHRNRTVLEAGKVVSVETRTNDDGDYYAVLARQGEGAGEGGLTVLGVDGRIMAPTDIFPSDYWRYATVRQGRLLDTQKGILRDVEMTAVAGREGCYDMTGELTMQLCYDDGRWVGGSFDGRGKEVLYTRREMPADAPWNFSLEDVPAGEPASRYVMMAQNEQR
ncbi:DUF6134 family protein [Oceanibaculum nanhaiense]|jgi:hypothetical protein|uniref:DUF6134 family protein n=1 Tax=Oceanibaculum nanhaiense TaxID=1909734 RepID=UPI000A3CDFD3|nr:DUF6134 family protein [Oceanibaculum nanhaiense]